MIDSLIYNRTKFVKESEYIKRYVGRTITKGANVYTYTFHSDGRFYGTQVGNTTDYQSTGTIAYQVDCGDDDVYVAVQSKKTPQFFKLSEFLQNGGVSHSPLIHLYHAVSRFRKEISMALSYLLFNKLKWFNFNPDAKNQTLAGKQVYTAPARVHINDPSSTSPVNGEGMAYSNHDYDVVGVGNSYYICHGTIRAAGDGTYDTDFVIDKSAVTPIWGGKHPLIRLYQGFKSLLFSKKVA